MMIWVADSMIGGFDEFAQPIQCIAEPSCIQKVKYTSTFPRDGCWGGEPALWGELAKPPQLYDSGHHWTFFLRSDTLISLRMHSKVYGVKS